MSVRLRQPSQNCEGCAWRNRQSPTGNWRAIAHGYAGLRTGYDPPMTHRRSSVHQQPAGTVVSLTPRDAKIIKALTRYRYLRAPYLHAFAGGQSGKRFIERLGLLFHEGYLGRPHGQWALPDARRRPALYERGSQARTQDGEARTFLGRDAHKQLEHSALICAVLASIEIACREPGTPRFIPWPEILARAPEATRADPQPFRLQGAGNAVIPDGLFGLEYEGPAYRFFALEIDRGTMPISRAGPGTSLTEKYARYEALITQGVPRRQLGVSSFIVLTVTTGETRATEIVRQTRALREPGRFLCMAVGERELDRPVPVLLSAPWRRSGLAPVTLSRGASTHPKFER